MLHMHREYIDYRKARAQQHNYRRARAYDEDDVNGGARKHNCNWLPNVVY